MIHYEAMENLGDIVEIYALCDPRTDRVMYVGKAKCSHRRLKSHLREKRRNHTPLYQWISELRSLRLCPVVRILERLPDQHWKEAERQWIKFYREKHDLLNLADGGNEPHCSRQTRQKNGSKNAHLLHNDPKKKRLWEIKRSIGQALKAGELSEKHKEKLRLAAKKAPHLFGEYAEL